MKNLYETILDADLDDMTEKMTDAEAYKAIKIFLNTHMWPWSNPDSRWDKVEYKFGKDRDGYYIDTEGTIRYCSNGDLGCRNFLEYLKNIDTYNRAWEDTHKGQLCPKFRWRTHKGNICLAENLQSVISIEGLPTNIDYLYMAEGLGALKKNIDLTEHHIKKIKMHNVGKVTLSGKAVVDELCITRSWNSREPIIKGPIIKNQYRET